MISLSCYWSTTCGFAIGYRDWVDQLICRRSESSYASLVDSKRLALIPRCGLEGPFDLFDVVCMVVGY